MQLGAWQQTGLRNCTSVPPFEAAEILSSYFLLFCAPKDSLLLKNNA
jgi:hypothetical protein